MAIYGMRPEGLALYEATYTQTKTVDLGSFNSWADYEEHVYTVFYAHASQRRLTEQMSKLVNSRNASRLAKFLKARNEISYELPFASTQYAYDVSGSFVDVGRYVNGEPECMVNFDSSESQAKFLDVVIRTAGLPSSATNYFGNIIDIIDWLEANGTRCRLFWQIDHSNYGYGGAYCINRFRAAIQLKDYSEPMDLVRLTNVFLGTDSSSYCRSMAVVTCEDSGMSGHDHLYNNQIVFPDQTYDPFERVPVATFPSAWYNRWDERVMDKDSRKWTAAHGYLAKPTPFQLLREIGLAELIPVELREEEPEPDPVD